VGKRRIGIVLCERTDEDGARIFLQACRMGLEGIIVSKRLLAPSGPVVMGCSPIRRGGPLRNPDHSAARLGYRFAVGPAHHMSD
jgi:hypothetical protein